MSLRSAALSSEDLSSKGRGLIAALLCLSLFGCSSRPQLPQPEQSWEQHQRQLLPLTQWQVLGKIRIQSADDDSSANLNWWQRQDHYRIYIAGPLGQGAVNIEGSESDGITLDISGEGRYQADSPERLLYQQLGWEVPISQMPYWIKGLPAPQGDYSTRLDTLNRAQQLQQSGWTIDYLDYHNDLRPQLPRKIRLQRGDSLRLTLILKQWQTDLPTSTPEKPLSTTK
ncbi:MAG: outer membrane lipoprotein LolB [Motiliproteus sp.]